MESSKAIKILKSCFTKGVLGLRFSIAYFVMETLIRAALFTASNKIRAAQPTTRPVYGTNWYNNFYPFQENETFNFNVLLITALCSLGSLLIIVSVVWGLFRRVPLRLIIDDALIFLWGITLSIAWTLVITNSIKNIYGRVRPDFLSRCFGEDRSTWPKVEDIPGIPQCRDDVKPTVIISGRRSFPSAHSSISTSFFLYLALYLYRKLTQITNTGSLRITLPFGIFLFGLSIAFSRLHDNRHFPSDVFIGIIIGSIITLIIFFFYENILRHVYDYYERKFGSKNQQQVELEEIQVDASATLNVPSTNKSSSVNDKTLARSTDPPHICRNTHFALNTPAQYVSLN